MPIANPYAAVQSDNNAVRCAGVSNGRLMQIVGCRS